jgi:glucosamine-6-phosphate deaminase
MTLCIKDDESQVNAAAAAQAAECLRTALARSGRARLVAATGRSQVTLLARLANDSSVDWSRVELFHLDEYVGLPSDHPASFARFLRDRLVAPAGIRTTHFIDGLGEPQAVIRDLTRELTSRAPDLLLAGVGENGHLAFNEPPADFDRKDAFFVVELDETSRRQQIGEGWFPSLEAVPRTAITMSIRQILQAETIICVVQGTRKAKAVAACFGDGVTPLAPASILRTHAGATVYLDRAAAAGLPPGVIGI